MASTTARRQREKRAHESSQAVNVGESERLASLAAGTVLAVSGLSRSGLFGVFLMGLGGALVYRGLSGHCHAYEALGVDTSQK